MKEIGGVEAIKLMNIIKLRLRSGGMPVIILCLDLINSVGIPFQEWTTQKRKSKHGNNVLSIFAAEPRVRLSYRMASNFYFVKEDSRINFVTRCMVGHAHRDPLPLVSVRTRWWKFS